MDLTKLSDSELRELLGDTEVLIDQYDSEQMAWKILINSAYGAVGNIYFRYHNLYQAEGITISGQATIKWAEKFANEYINRLLKTDGVDYVVAIDTDSIYVNFSDVVDIYRSKTPNASDEDVVNFLDLFCETRLSKVIADGYDKLFDMCNGVENRLEMKREAIGQALFSMKKRYVMRVSDLEGVRFETPIMKIMGLESVRSTTPKFCRERIKQTFNNMFTMDQTDLVKYIKSVEDEFMSLTPDEIAENKGIGDMAKWNVPDGFASGTPYHIKAAMVHNRMIDKLDLHTKYETIRNGDQVKLLHLKSPNPCGNKVIAFTNMLPPEFGLNNYIDKITQYDKTYLEPVKRVLDIGDLKTEETTTLDDFF